MVTAKASMLAYLASGVAKGKHFRAAATPTWRQRRSGRRGRRQTNQTGDCNTGDFLPGTLLSMRRNAGEIQCYSALLFSPADGGGAAMAGMTKKTRRQAAATATETRAGSRLRAASSKTSLRATFSTRYLKPKASSRATPSAAEHAGRAGMCACKASGLSSL